MLAGKKSKFLVGGLTLKEKKYLLSYSLKYHLFTILSRLWLK